MPSPPTASPFPETPPEAADATYVRPELVVEVEYSEVTSAGLLRAPVFKRLRPDKAPEEAVFMAETPVPTFAAPRRPLAIEPVSVGPAPARRPPRRAPPRRGRPRSPRHEPGEAPLARARRPARGHQARPAALPRHRRPLHAPPPARPPHHPHPLPQRHRRPALLPEALRGPAARLRRDRACPLRGCERRPRLPALQQPRDAALAGAARQPGVPRDHGPRLPRARRPWPPRHLHRVPRER